MQDLSNSPDFILFTQHGWADDNRAMTTLAKSLATEQTLIVAPNLGYLNTWLWIEPLIKIVEQVASQQIATYPNVPLRIVGHSMGGLIWLEVLHRHPDWWLQIHSLVLIGSPVGGSDLGRLIDPLGLGIGIARDLGINRKPIAEAIAAEIPTLVIAGDYDNGSDGTVTIDCTKFANAHFVCLPGVSHPASRHHAMVIATIQDFWQDHNIGESIEIDHIIRRLHAVPGMTDGHRRDFAEAKVLMHLDNGGTIRGWRNPLGVNHVFVACPQGTCLYAGFVGWLHAQDLQHALNDIRQAYAIE
ncbi:MAG: alpha/beta hydrolase [Synechococcales cyanobacterium M58_A2018_015]|nr:alpha/beta hydrolase [Synechococcales cyanobacterium M58_A2018_015]